MGRTGGIATSLAYVPKHFGFFFLKEDIDNGWALDFKKAKVLLITVECFLIYNTCISVYHCINVYIDICLQNSFSHNLFASCDKCQSIV